MGVLLNLVLEIELTSKRRYNYIKWKIVFLKRNIRQ